MEVQKWSSFPQRLQQAAQTSPGDQELDNMDLKRGPWTVDEDLVLVGYIAKHGEGRWNSLARSAGLKRTGKSCRLRWLNYLRPDVRRGNLTPEEQLLILELHSRWGNRWSKIAQYLPGRTDNEIKNYWRTRVQKHAKHLNCDVGSNKFKDAMRYLWMPRLLERIRAASCRGRPSTAASMQADVVDVGKVRRSTPNPHSPLESSDVDDPPAGSSMMSNAVGSAAGELMRSPSSDSGALVSRHDQALQDDAVWAIECSVPESLDGVHGALRDQLQQQCDLDEWGSGDMFVDDFWSFEDIWSMEEGMF